MHKLFVYVHAHSIKLTSLIFLAIVDGRATEELVQCFQLQQCLLMGFTDSSERFCDMLLYHGLICHQIDQVLALRQSDPNPVRPYTTLCLNFIVYL